MCIFLRIYLPHMDSAVNHEQLDHRVRRLRAFPTLLPRAWIVYHRRFRLVQILLVQSLVVYLVLDPFLCVVWKTLLQLSLLVGICSVFVGSLDSLVLEWSGILNFFLCVYEHVRFSSSFSLRYASVLNVRMFRTEGNEKIADVYIFPYSFFCFGLALLYI